MDLIKGRQARNSVKAKVKAVIDAVHSSGVVLVPHTVADEVLIVVLVRVVTRVLVGQHPIQQGHGQIPASLVLANVEDSS